MKKVRIASGAGYAGDRIEPAIDVMKNDLDIQKVKRIFVDKIHLNET